MMKDCKPVSSPAISGAYSQEQQLTPLTSDEASRYLSAVGRVMWLLPERPDMAFIGKELARHVHDPMVSDLKTLKHLPRH
eukprot:7489064-Heterocapsa_arctica.AAC.1